MTDFEEASALMAEAALAAGRQIRQMHTFNTAMGFVMYALCEDGTIWSRSPFAPPPENGWDAVPPIPGSWADVREKAEAHLKDEHEKLAAAMADAEFFASFPPGHPHKDNGEPFTA